MMVSLVLVIRPMMITIIEFLRKIMISLVNYSKNNGTLMQVTNNLN